MQRCCCLHFITGALNDYGCYVITIGIHGDYVLSVVVCCFFILFKLILLAQNFMLIESVLLLLTILLILTVSHKAACFYI